MALVSMQNFFEKSIMPISGTATTEASEQTGEGSDTDPNAEKFSKLPLLSVQQRAVLDQIISPTVDLGKDFELIIMKCLTDNESKVVAKESITIETDFCNINDTAEHVDMDTSVEVETEGWLMVKEVETRCDKDEQNTAEAVEEVEPDMPDKSEEKIQDNDVIIKYTSISYVKTTKRKQKDIKSKKRKVKSENKKWKPVGLENMGFDLSLFPWQQPMEQQTTVEMDQELKKFEEECENCGSGIENSDKEEAQPEVKVEQGQSEVKDVGTEQGQSQIVALDKIQTSSEVRFFERHCDHGYFDGVGCYYCSDTYFSYDMQPIEIDLERWISNDRCIAFVDEMTGNLHGKAKRLRSKKKWRVDKGRKQAKTKYCRSLNNSSHGVIYYMHHRKYKMILMPTDRCSRCHNRERVSIRAIDRKWDKIQKEQGTKLVPNPIVPPSGNNSSTSRTAAPRRNQPRPLHTLTAYNADSALAADLVNILMNIQDRDLTPEDYDLLLRLDERVKPKTVDEKTIQSLRTETIAEPIEELCSICLEAYIIGHLRRFLPCGHGFHDDCTLEWLKTSTKCPLDGLEIMEMDH